MKKLLVSTLCREKRLGMGGVGGDSSLGAWRLPGAKYFFPLQCFGLYCSTFLSCFIYKVLSLWSREVLIASRCPMHHHVGPACDINCDYLIMSAADVSVLATLGPDAHVLIHVSGLGFPVGSVAHHLSPGEMSL